MTYRHLAACATAPRYTEFVHSPNGWGCTVRLGDSVSSGHDTTQDRALL